MGRLDEAEQALAQARQVSYHGRLAAEWESLLREFEEHYELRAEEFRAK